MNKKSILKVLFIGLFLLIATISQSHFSPENEIKTIETLPRKSHATLDIEVTKVKSQPIVGNLDKKNKNIIIDFSTIQDNKQNKMIIDESNYSLFATNSLDNLPSYSSNKVRVKSQTAPKYSFEKIGDKIIKINFEEQPEQLYIGVLNKSINSVDKVFKVNINEPSLTDVTTRRMFINNPVYLSNNLTGVYGFNGGTSNFLPSNLPGSRYSAKFLSPPPTPYGLESAGWTNNPTVTLSGTLNGTSIGNFNPTSGNNSILKKSQYIWFKNSSGAETPFKDTSISTNTTSSLLIPKFSNIGGESGSGYVGISFSKWDLKQHQFILKIIDQNNQSGNIENIEINIPPLDPRSYLDTVTVPVSTILNNAWIRPGALGLEAGVWANTNSSPTYNLKEANRAAIVGESRSKDSKTDVNLLGVFKIWDKSTLPQITPNDLKFEISTATITLTSSIDNNRKIIGTLYLGDSIGNNIGTTTLLAENARNFCYLWLKITTFPSTITGTTTDETFVAEISKNNNPAFFLKLGTSSLISKMSLTLDHRFPGSMRTLLINNPIYISKDPRTGVYGFNQGYNASPTGINNTKHTANFYGARGIIKGRLNMSTTSDPPSTYGLSPYWTYDNPHTGDKVLQFFDGKGFETVEFNHDSTKYKDTRDIGKKIFKDSNKNSTILENFSNKSHSFSGVDLTARYANIDGNNGYLGIGLDSWNLKGTGFTFMYSNVWNAVDGVRVRVAPFDPEAYYDNSNSSIKLDNQNTNIDTTKFWNTSNIGNDYSSVTYNHTHTGTSMEKNIDLANISQGIELGTIKILPTTDIPQIASDVVNPSKPLKFYTADNITFVDQNDSENSFRAKIYIIKGNNKFTELKASEARELNRVVLEFLDPPEIGNYVVNKNKPILKLGIGEDTEFNDEIISNLKINITTCANALLIETLNNYGQWEPVKRNATFDHGRVIAGQDIAEPILHKNFRVRRLDNSSLGTINFNLTVSNSNAPLKFKESIIDHKFISTIDNGTPTNKTRNFKITSEIQNPKISNSLPVGVYQKTSNLIIHIQP